MSNDVFETILVESKSNVTYSSNIVAPVYSTLGERQDFNDWYYEKIHKKSKVKLSRPKKSNDFNESSCESSCYNGLLGNASNSGTKTKADTTKVKLLSPKYFEEDSEKVDTEKKYATDNSCDKCVKKETTVHMSVETVLVLIFTMLSIAGSTPFKMPKFYSSPHLSNILPHKKNLLTSNFG